MLLHGISYAQAEQKLQDDYTLALRSGAVTPATSLVGSLNFILLIGWLVVCLLVPKTIYQPLRIFTFTTVTCVSIWNLLYVRSIGIVGSIGVGLNSALCTLLAVNFMLVHDPRLFRRLVLRSKNEKEPNGHSFRKEQAHDRYDALGPEAHLERQPMPPSLWRRLIWVLDLITSFRGGHWLWQPSSQVPNNRNLLTGNIGQEGSLTRNLCRFLTSYVLIDIVKCLMIKDPYFLGSSTSKPPDYLTDYIASPMVVYTYHVILGATGVILAIDLIYALAVLVQVHLAGPKVLGLNASPLSFPPVWGGVDAVLSDGLRGFWAVTWHQTFRLHFICMGDATAAILFGDHVSAVSNSPVAPGPQRKSSRTSTSALVVRTMVAFLLSGVLHACASYTLLGPTQPWRSFLFFAIQPLGILTQVVCSRVLFDLRSNRSRRHQSSVLHYAWNAGSSLLWLWSCSGLLLDDMTKGGIWLLEPIPVSLVRGLGLSKEDVRFWCW